MYLGQTEDSALKKAGAGILNSLILVGAVVGFYLMSRKKSFKQYKPGYSKRKHSRGKTLPLP